MRRLTMSLFAGLLMLGSCFVSPAMAATHDVLQPSAAYASPEKAVNLNTCLIAVAANPGMASAGESAEQTCATPAPNFAGGGDPDYDNPVHFMVAQGVDPDTGSDTSHPNNDGISLASIPGDNDDDTEGEGRIPLAA